MHNRGQPSHALALVGHGKMNRLIEQLAPQHGFDVAAVLDSKSNPDGLGIRSLPARGVDVAIEFTGPESAPRNLQALAAAGVRTVCGTTGWYEHLDEIQNAVSAAGAALVYGSNFSVGVAVFKRVVSRAAELMKSESEYAAWGWEIHHSAKKDAPSGTMLALLKSMQQVGYSRHVDVAASRAGAHPGTHEVGWDSPADTIMLRHVARSRDGFANGALRAARWILNRRGVYTFDDVLFGVQTEKDGTEKE